jgi:hypothetical protein
LQESLDEFGQPETIAIGPGNEIYNGHQRLKSWADKFGDIDVDVRVANRALTEKEREKLTVFLHKGAAGEWNFDVLANEFEVDDLLDWGFEKAELDIDLWSIDDDDDSYTRNIEAPIYEIKGEKPELKDLYDKTRTKELLVEIEAAKLPEDIKDFLSAAAWRHTIIDFQKVAEYYAHADLELQRLMENNALIIIDFNRAIELGYIRLSEQVASQYREDYPSD